MIDTIESSVFTVLATIPEQQLNSLVKLLFAACIVTSKSETNRELKALSTQVSAGAKKAASTLGVDNVVPLLIKIVNGTEIEEDSIKLVIRGLRKAIRLDIKSDREISNRTLDMLNSTTSYLITNGEPVLRKLKSLAPALDDEVITKNLISGNIPSQSEFLKPLTKIVKKHSGRDGSLLTQEESNKLKAKDPEAHKEYTRLRRNFNQIWKDELRDYVFASKKKLVDYKTLQQYLRSKKIQNPLPQGFDGLIDANGKFYTKAGKLLSNVPGVGFSVVMNPSYDPKTDSEYVFTTVNEAGKISQYVYTTSYRKKATDEKFEKVESLDKVLDGIHKKWLTYMRKGDFSPACVASTALELLYEYSARIGSMGNSTGGQSTYGVSTLECRMVTITGNRAVIRYKGKKGVSLKHQIDGGSGQEAKILLSNIKKLMAGKGPKDRLFTFEINGQMHNMTGNLINQWFKKLGSPVTVHKLRHVKGTEAFIQLLKDNEKKIFDRPKPMTQVEADQMLNALATKVGAMLGHVTGVGSNQKATGSTAIQSYISPEVMVDFYARLGLRTPKFLEKFMIADGTND